MKITNHAILHPIIMQKQKIEVAILNIFIKKFLAFLEKRQNTPNLKNIILLKYINILNQGLNLEQI